MVERGAGWFRLVAILMGLLALGMIPAVMALLNGQLPLWLHVPLMLLALTGMAGGAAATGVALLEYRSRSAQ